MSYNTHIKYHDNSKLRPPQIAVEQWYIKRTYEARCYHRENKPAYIRYGVDGMLLEEKWYISGKLHRIDGPAWSKYRNGKLKMAIWYNNGRETSSASYEEKRFDKYEDILSINDINL